MSQVGRIGGHLLEANLERQGIDVAFKNTTFDSTPILYLDVTNNRIGVKTDSPQYDLDIQTDVSTTNAEATAQARLDNVLIKCTCNIFYYYRTIKYCSCNRPRFNCLAKITNRQLRYQR